MIDIVLPRKVTSELAEEIGWHLGDGSMNYYSGKGFYQLRGHIVDDRERYLCRIKPIYKSLFDLDVSLRDMISSGVFGFQIWQNELVDFKVNFLNLLLGRKMEFGIPEKVKGRGKYLKSFLRGYFDTDGCLYLEKKRGELYPRIEMASVSKMFVLELVDVLKQLGFRLSYYVEKREQKGWKDLHRVIIRGDEMANKWFIEINPKNPKHWIKY